jgi:hypothetical protein
MFDIILLTTCGLVVVALIVAVAGVFRVCRR